MYIDEENKYKFQRYYENVFDQIFFVNLSSKNYQNKFYEFTGYQEGLKILYQTKIKALLKLFL